MNAPLPAAHVHLELSSRADNIPIVRQALSGMADATGLSPVDVNDIGLATSEACNNVSMHAYTDGDGPLEVEMLLGDATMAVTVRDHGIGAAIDAPRAGFPSEVDGELGGIGLPAILALARNVTWSAPDGGGTAVEMTFATGLPLPPTACAAPPAPLEPIAPGQLADTLEVAMAPLSLARCVLPRLLRAVAARAHFSVDRHGDAQRVGATLLADDSAWGATGCVCARLAVVDKTSLEVAIGPLDARHVRRTANAVGAVESGLDTSIMSDSRGERLVVRIERTRP